MISPVPGIHRPSNNGAPARQTRNFNQQSIIFQLRFQCCQNASYPDLRANVCKRVCPHRSTRDGFIIKKLLEPRLPVVPDQAQRLRHLRRALHVPRETHARPHSNKAVKEE